MESVEELRGAVIEFIGRGADGSRDDATFNQMARRLFDYQFRANLPYRKFCERRAKRPETVHTWFEIPPVPIAAFKELTLACGPVEQAAACFMTSGTTDPAKRGRHYHFTLEVYDASAATFFKANVLPDVDRFPLLILGAPPELQPHSSLAHYLGLMRERFGGPGSEFYIGKDGLESERLLAALEVAEHAGTPVGMLGASFAFVHFLDRCRADGRRFALPTGSRIMDTGGFKGKSREVPREELYGLCAEHFGVGRNHCVNMYGMTELSMQLYDSPLRRRVLGRGDTPGMETPPWARTMVVDAETLLPIPEEGRAGIICHYDLANLSSVVGILTEDIGVATPGGTCFLGRVQGTESRGCSVSVDEMLAARGAIS
jgi:hypothetical protein